MYIQKHTKHPDGSTDHYELTLVESKIDPLRWQKLGLTYTATGYGRRIPTQHKVKFKGKWRRVYCCIFSNIGTLYIGKLSDNLIVGD